MGLTYTEIKIETGISFSSFIRKGSVLPQWKYFLFIYQSITIHIFSVYRSEFLPIYLSNLIFI